MSSSAVSSLSAAGFDSGQTAPLLQVDAGECPGVCGRGICQSKSRPSCVGEVVVQKPHMSISFHLATESSSSITIAAPSRSTEESRMCMMCNNRLQEFVGEAI